MIAQLVVDVESLTIVKLNISTRYDENWIDRSFVSKSILRRSLIIKSHVDLFDKFNFTSKFFSLITQSIESNIC